MHNKVTKIISESFNITKKISLSHNTKTPRYIFTINLPPRFSTIIQSSLLQRNFPSVDITMWFVMSFILVANEDELHTLTDKNVVHALATSRCHSINRVVLITYICSLFHSSYFRKTKIKVHNYLQDFIMQHLPHVQCKRFISLSY